MFMISKGTVHSVMSLRNKIADPKKRAECIAQVENMIKMKKSHPARAERGSCCGNIRNLAHQIDSELWVLQNTLDAWKNEDSSKTSFLFEDYIASLRKNYIPEPEHW